MTQPFRTHHLYRSRQWDDIVIEYKSDYVAITSKNTLDTVSSAVWRGGFSRATTFVNWKVPLDYDSNDPGQMMNKQLLEWGYQPAQTVGLMTAAKLSHAAVTEEYGDAFRLVCCTTAGTGNAARAGMVARTYSAYELGTINTVVLIDGRMSQAAMINAVMTAVEAKAAALQDAGVHDQSGEIATGTTSDAIVIGVSQGSFAETHAFAGTATTLGDAIARHVYQTVIEAVVTQKED